jgi:hypothetical protein
MKNAARTLSDTLLEFARPLLEHLPSDATPEQGEEVMRLAVTVWNAIVADRWERGTFHLREVHAHLEAAEEPGRTVMLSVLDALVARKRLLFEADLRAIGRFELSGSASGKLRVRAEARRPQELTSAAR